MSTPAAMTDVFLALPATERSRILRALAPTMGRTPAFEAIIGRLQTLEAAINR